jgi:tetratricopeptide (TPR) repeat protein
MAEGGETDLDLALDLIDDGSLDEGMAMLRQVLAAHPDDVRALFGMGAALSRRGEKEKAVEYYRRVAEIIPDAAEALDAYAAALGDAGRLAEACEVCDRIADLPGFEGAAALRRARLTLQAGDLPRALAELAEAYRLEHGRPKRRTISFEHGRALARAGRPAEALALFDRAVADTAEPESEEQAEEMARLRAECAAALRRN